MFCKEFILMGIDLIPLMSFVLVTTFTPGPNNLSSASMGVLFGYRHTLRYLSGIAAGFFLVMLLCAGLSGVLLRVIPSLEAILRMVGAGYILWLAAVTLRTHYAFDESGQPVLAFSKGLLLQLVNPKVAVYGMTLYSTFLTPVSQKPGYLALSAWLLATTAFCATSTWAIFGSLIRKYLHHPGSRKLVNLILTLLLVYTAVELSGLVPGLGE